jgi:hypothetical protein
MSGKPDKTHGFEAILPPKYRYFNIKSTKSKVFDDFIIDLHGKNNGKVMKNQRKQRENTFIL